MERERQARWDEAHLRTVSTKISVAEHGALRRACECENTTVYELLQILVRDWLINFLRENWI